MRFHFHLLPLLALLTLALAAPAPVVERDLISDTVAVLRGVLESLIRGTTETMQGIGTIFTVSTYITPKTANGRRIKVTGGRGLGYNAFLGIPFAEPLTGRKRFDRPTPKVYTGDIVATKFSKACMQYIPLLDGAIGQSEDCLYLNVVTPEGVAGSSQRLPVMVWIYGGGFFGGAASYYSALAPNLINQSKQMGKPVIHVAMNYRLGPWGWGVGKEFKNAGAANNGIRDQRLAIEWVRENIAAFGGDPNKITLFGESAGAISTSIHLLNPNNAAILKGAILQSGFASTIPMPRTEDYQSPYDQLVNKAGCAGAADTFDCLKNVDTAKLSLAVAAVGNTPSNMPGLAAVLWRPTIDGDLIPDSPYNLISQGKFAKVPFITGTNKDEGGLFVDFFLRSQEDIPTLIDKLYPGPLSQDLINKIFEKYPNVASLGSPFDTGDRTFGLSVAYKQMSAIATDVCFVSRRRFHLREANKNGFTPTWAYAFEGPTPILPDFLGVMHATDIPYVYGAVNPLIPLVGWTSKDQTLSKQIMSYWVNFANSQNPNGGSLPNWPTHNFPANKNALLLKPGATQVIQDDYREDRVGLFNDPAVWPLMSA